jgi:hypothetical protein
MRVDDGVFASAEAFGESGFQELAGQAGRPL